MAPTICSRCGDAVDEGCDPRDELAELDALLKRLSHYLKSKINSTIAPTFCNHCRDIVEKGCDPWAELAVTELDALSELLRLKRYDLKGKINRSHSPIIRQLPPDVTSTIFEFCLPDFTDHLLPYTKVDLSIPLSLGAICRYWREIAWSNPNLWSSLAVRVTRKHDSPKAVGIAREWLARSGLLPLSIRISSDLSTPLTTLAKIINRYSNRWSDLDLSMDPHGCQKFGTDIHAPILKSIRLHSKAKYEIVDPHFQLTCPRLERASLSSISMKGINIQWDNLTHLTLHSMSIYNFFVILRKAPRLVFCEASGSCAHYKMGSVGAPVHTSLRSLQLLVPKQSSYFLNKLIAPHLEEFCLPFSMGVITSFLRRSACSLRSFSVTFCSFPTYFDDLTGLLRSMPSLNTLSITALKKNTVPTDHDPRNIFQLVVEVLSSQSASLQQGFLPNLEVLEYTGKLYLRSGNYNNLYSLPPADNAIHSPLRLLKLDLHPATRIPKNVISYLSSLMERGVATKVSSKSKDIFQSSIDYYRRREDSLCHDWADDLESSLFLSLEEQGVAVDVLSKSEDILQPSIDYYGSRNDFLSRDWAGNLDSNLFS